MDNPIIVTEIEITHYTVNVAFIPGTASTPLPTTTTTSSTAAGSPASGGPTGESAGYAGIHGTHSR